MTIYLIGGICTAIYSRIIGLDKMSLERRKAKNSNTNKAQYLALYYFLIVAFWPVPLFINFAIKLGLATKTALAAESILEVILEEENESNSIS